jgi:type III secretory pathway component EscS
MSELIELTTREGFGLVVALLVPLIGTAIGAAIVAGWLSSALGVRDGALGQCLRALAVVFALGLVLDGMAASVTEYATGSWKSLGSLHR